MAKFYNKKSPFCRKVQDWMKNGRLNFSYAEQVATVGIKKSEPQKSND